MATFTLSQLVLACLATGLLVSVLVTSIHSQWQILPPHSAMDLTESRGLVGSSTQAAALRLKIDQLSAEVAKANSRPSGNLQTKTADATTRATTPTTDIAIHGGAAQAFDEYIALHKKILAKDPSVEQRFIVGSYRAPRATNSCQ